MPTIPGFLGRNRLEWQYTKLRKWGRLRLLPSANEVAERLCFYTCLSFCPRGRGCLPQCMLGYTPQADTPLGRHPLQQTTTAADGTHPTGMHSCFFMLIHGSGGSKGGAPKAQNFLNRMQSFWKIWQNRMLPPSPRGLAPPPTGESWIRPCMGREVSILVLWFTH